MMRISGKFLFVCLAFAISGPVVVVSALAQDQVQVATVKAKKIKTVADENLVSAVEQGNLAAVKTALDAGANPSVARKDRFSALALAAERGQTEITKALLNAGANPNLKSKSRQTALQLAATRGHPDIVRMLVEAGADINYRGNKKKYVFSLLTPMMLAANSGHVAIVDYLLKKGADPAIRDRRKGTTALHYAARNGRADIMALLIAHGADINQPDMFLVTPFFAAIASENWQSVALAIIAGADVNHRVPRSFRVGADDQGMRPIMLAANRLDEDVVFLLLLLGADPAEQPYPEETALMAAEAGFARHPNEKKEYTNIRHALEDPDWAKAQAADLYGRRLSEAIRDGLSEDVRILTRLNIEPVALN